MVASHNESTIWIAKHCAPTVEEFVARMNEKAAQLGMTSTKYYNTSGLPGYGSTPDNSSSSRDLLLLGMEITKHAQLMKITSIPYATVSNGKFKTTYRNHNGLVINYNDEVDGIKTGHLKDSKYSIAVTKKKDNRRIIAVVSGLPTMSSRAESSKLLLNSAFNKIITIVINAYICN